MFFFSLLMDGSVDAGNVEDKLVVLLHCQIDDTERYQLKVDSYLSTTPTRLMLVVY